MIVFDTIFIFFLISALWFLVCMLCGCFLATFFKKEIDAFSDYIFNGDVPDECKVWVIPIVFTLPFILIGILFVKCLQKYVSTVVYFLNYFKDIYKTRVEIEILKEEIRQLKGGQHTIPDAEDKRPESPPSPPIKKKYKKNPENRPEPPKGSDL